MSLATALILAAAPVTELPVEAVPAATEAAAASSGAGLSYLQLMLHEQMPQTRQHPPLATGRSRLAKTGLSGPARPQHRHHARAA